MTSFQDWATRVKGQAPAAPGSSPLERLPNELLHKILLHVITPTPKKYWFAPHQLPGETSNTASQSLKSCLLASRTLNSSALFLMYREPKIKTQVSKASSLITRFFTTVEQNHQLGNLVRTLDITQIGNKEDFELSSHALSFLPQLRDVRVSLSHISDIESLQTLIFQIPSLESLSVTISNVSENKSHIFRNTFNSLPRLTASALTTLKITGTDSGEAFYIPEEFFSTLLPRMRRLRVLDLSKTSITSEALATIPMSTRLTHLNISGCSQLSPSFLIKFLASHPAIHSSLTVLNAGSITYENTPLQEHHVNSFLSSAPPCLRSLDLCHSYMGPSNIPHLQRLCLGGKLEELSVGSNLLLEEIEEMLLSPRYDFASGYRVSSADSQIDSYLKPADENKYATVLEPMKAAVAMCKFRQRLDSVKLSKSQQHCYSGMEAKSKLRYLDISSISKEEQGQVKQSVLLGKQTSPLEVLEMRRIPWDDYKELPRMCRAVGWRENWEGDRIWVERLS